MTTPIRTRIAPSPTGFLHLGTARTALYSWAFARHHGGEFVLRIEDTDVARSTQDSVEQILAAMKWLGLQYDEGPVYQMQRLERYRAVVDQMLAQGTAYLCYCTPQDLDRMKADHTLPPASELTDEALDDSNLNRFVKAGIRALPDGLINSALKTDDVLRRTINNLDLRQLLAYLNNSNDLTQQINRAVTDAVKRSLVARLRGLL